MSKRNTYHILDDEKLNYVDVEAYSLEDAVRSYCKDEYFAEAMGTEEIDLQVIDPEGETHDVTVDVDVMVTFNVKVI